jgi:hypothetical protein
MLSPPRLSALSGSSCLSSFSIYFLCLRPVVVRRRLSEGVLQSCTGLRGAFNPIKRIHPTVARVSELHAPATRKESKANKRRHAGLPQCHLQKEYCPSHTVHMYQPQGLPKQRRNADHERKGSQVNAGTHIESTSKTSEGQGKQIEPKLHPSCEETNTVSEPAPRSRCTGTCMFTWPGH